MSENKDRPVSANEPTMCSVCAWRNDCKKKFSYQQGGTIKCADFTRDMAMPADKKERS